MRGSASLVIDVPIQKVFDFVADIENMDRWITGVSSEKGYKRLRSRWRPMGRSRTAKARAVSRQ